jgi:two-component system sensor kinase FixL
MVRRLRELVSKGNVSARPEPLPKLIQEASFIGFLDEALLGASHEVDLDPAAEWVQVDAIQIQQVLINLIRNALQAMEKEPLREVVISTRATSRTTAEVSVADTGCGIPQEVREALFSPFQSSKAEGMGIGLSISRTIVEAHGGKIWAEDRDGGGTVFRFTLRMAEPPSHDEGRSPA